MFAVIFRAEVDEFDASYKEMANRMRELAMREYECIDFTSCTEGNSEIAISYWPSRERIIAWRNNPEHRKAQLIGKSRWYKSYQVEIVEILDRHGSEV